MSVDVVGLRALAEKMARAYTRMCEIDQGVGGLAIREPDMLKDFMAWGDATENEHADTVLALLDEITTLRAENERLTSAQRPCDGGCDYNSGPEETCSLHGRPVAEVWELQQTAQRRVNDLEAALADRDARIKAALDLHAPMKIWESDRSYTLACRECKLEPHPCPTVRALSVPAVPVPQDNPEVTRKADAVDRRPHDKYDDEIPEG